MQRFFFHLDERGSITIDHEGRELFDLEAARHEAIGAACAIMSHEVGQGNLSLSSHIDIAEENGERLMRVEFKDALVITGL